jgi:hypothetical protein
MGSTRSPDPAVLPEHLRAVPIHIGDGESPVRLCVVVRKQADAVGGPFVLLRDFADASVFLGCILDAEQRVWDWIELWVQNADKLPSFLPNFREKFSNDILDERWSITADALRELNPGAALKTGWETSHPQPIAIDSKTSKSSHPNADNGKPWVLCKDDALLRNAGLPPYSTSVARYWYSPGGTKPQFVPVSVDAPDNATIPLSEAVPDQQIIFNPQAGLILARRFSPIGIDEYADALSGKPWRGAENAKQPYVPRGVYAVLQDPKQLQESGAYLFLGKQGAAGRLVEVFHLKLQLFTEVVRLARNFVQKQQLPLLNISAESFRVSLSETAAGLPFLWTAQVDLAKPSQAFALPVETSTARYFLPAKGSERPIYLPEGMDKTSRGEGTVRIRKLMPQDKSLVVIEGTIVTDNKLDVSSNDLMWIRLPVTNGRVDLYGHIQPSEAAGEARFRTEAQRLPEATIAALKSAEGVSLSKVAYEFIPMLSSACDLYSLGVLAARLFLVNEASTLPVALDELLNLARQAGAEQGDLKLRVRTLFEKEARWNESIGPHRLLWEKNDPKIAAQILPMDLWWELLANLARLFPGLSAHSVCRDLGDAPSLALESVFNSPLSTLESLAARTRSLIVIDWKFNREIHSVISGFLEKLS